MSCSVTPDDHVSGGSRISRWGGGGRRPPMWALFGKNVCENERIGSRLGGGSTRRQQPPPGSANACHPAIITKLTYFTKVLSMNDC